jgi:hypothetical protein
MTAPLTVPAFRDISTTGLVWNGARAARARIYGFAANFASIVGGEQIALKANGGSEITTTMVSGDTSPTAAASRINTAMGATAVIVDGSRLILDDATSIEVTSNHASAATFAKLGLPVMKRDRGNTSQSSIIAPITAPDNLENLDCLSEPITVPAGTNRASIWIKRTGTIANNCGLVVALIPENTGDLVSGATSMIDYPEPLALQSTLSVQTDNPFGQQDAYFGLVRLIGSRGIGVQTQQLVTTIDPGVAQIRLFVGSMYSNGTEVFPYAPPSVSARISFGAR